MKFLPTDRRVVSGTLIVVGMALAVSAMLAGELLPGESFAQGLLVLVKLFPTFGVLLALFVLWVWGTGESQVGPGPFAPDLSDDVENRSHRQIATGVRERLTNASESQFQPRLSPSEEDIHERLYESGLRAIQTTVGLSETDARNAIEDGEWTDDKVAAAMLSSKIQQPLGARLRAILTPGRAYRRRVERTVAAIERLESHRRVGTERREPTQAEVPS